MVVIIDINNTVVRMTQGDNNSLMVQYLNPIGYWSKEYKRLDVTYSEWMKFMELKKFEFYKPDPRLIKDLQQDEHLEKQIEEAIAPAKPNQCSICGRHIMDHHEQVTITNCAKCSIAVCQWCQNKGTCANCAPGGVK